MFTSEWQKSSLSVLLPMMIAIAEAQFPEPTMHTFSFGCVEDCIGSSSSCRCCCCWQWLWCCCLLLRASLITLLAIICCDIPDAPAIWKPTMNTSSDSARASALEFGLKGGMMVTVYWSNDIQWCCLLLYECYIMVVWGGCINPKKKVSFFIIYRFLLNTRVLNSQIYAIRWYHIWYLGSIF